MGKSDINEDGLIETSEIIDKNEVNETTEETEATEATETRKFLLAEETFENFRKAQNEILDKTEVSPSIRKMVNMIITKEAINKIKQELILKYHE